MTSNAALDELKKIPELDELMKGADHVDAQVFTGRRTLRQFVSAMLIYEPAWVKALFRIRGVVARLLGLEHPGQAPAVPGPDELDFTPGAPVAFFTTFEAREDLFWTGKASDKHLAAFASVLAEPMADGQSRFTILTTVRYRNWAGPLYFNLIRPFHHLIIRHMGKHACKS